MLKPRTRAAIAAGAGLIAIPALIASPAQAKILDREVWQDSGQNVYECEGFTLVQDWAAEGRLMVKSGRRGDPMPYFMENVSALSVFTNPDTGNWHTRDQHFVEADSRITNISGNLYTIEVMQVGQPFVVRGMDGRIVTKDVGRVVVSIEVDNNGTPENPDDDIADESTLSLVSVSGPHPNADNGNTQCDVAEEHNLM